MSTFTLNSITVQGLNVIAKLVAGQTLEFTRIAVGDGAMPSDKTPLTVTDLSNWLFDVPITSVSSDGTGSATVRGSFSNADKETGFFYRELGLFAKDPDTQAEILYCYGNAAADAEWISPSGASSVIEKEVKIVTLVGNAEKIEANIPSGIYPTKEEMENALKAKADLDAPAEDGGRVLADQMRLDMQQVLYVDAAAGSDGIGSEIKPFKTIQDAVNAAYLGAVTTDIKIKPGTYAEDVTTPTLPGRAWRLSRNGSGDVKVKSIAVAACGYVLLDNLTFEPDDGDTAITITDVNSCVISQNTINANNSGIGIHISRSKAAVRNNAISNAATAIIADTNSSVSAENNAGTGNITGAKADNAIITWASSNTIAATTTFSRANGGGISAEGGKSSIPSNYSQFCDLGSFTDDSTLKTTLLSEFGKLGIGEARSCWFANNIAAGFGVFKSGESVQVQLIKGSNADNGYGTAVFHSAFTAVAYMLIQDGEFITPVPVNTSESPNSLQRSKAYSVGDYAYSSKIPTWAYLECITAGTTASEEPTMPSTINATVTDGTAVFKLYHTALQSEPVGSVRDFTVAFDPNTSWGGTWAKMDAGRVLVAAGTYKEGSDTYTYNLGDKGGEAKHKLTTDELSSHTHGASTNSAGSHYHQQYANQQVSAGLNTSININSSQYPAATAWTDNNQQHWKKHETRKQTAVSSSIPLVS
ncbi:right-handed parallel beta-helix repeat-containing protein [uncultured Megasphaera sp.]|uniref:right-handed parallel beta-helix repeat-containing protein n=1 Tax=uncultured Megasphaera sp. TaxID=165188 RepID=UPI00265D2B94|nr:right-handed parallel beta-helix repeat-containing protein [uncultured Megasphaera sp.]